MHASLRDLFWIRAAIPPRLRDAVSSALLRETTDRGLKDIVREFLLHERDATQLALIVLAVELSIEHPQRKEALLQCAESLMTRPDRYRPLLLEFRREMKKNEIFFKKKIKGKLDNLYGRYLSSACLP